MDIVLDTNIIRSDWHLKSKEFDILEDYLKKTDSSFVLPKIILEEIKGLFKRELKAEYDVIAKASSNLNHLLKEELANELVLDFESSTEFYAKRLIRRMDLTSNKIIDYNNDFLPELVQRAIMKSKPFKDEDRGFRDCIIWLTLLKYTQACHEKQIVFISNNPIDFGDGNKESPKLHPELLNDCENLNIKINYYRNLKDFIEKHSKKINALNSEWLSENIDEDELSNLVCDKLNDSSSYSITNWFEDKTGLGSTGYYRASQAIFICFDDEIFIYEMLDENTIINFSVNADVEIEFEYYENEYYENGTGRGVKNLVKYLNVTFYFSANYSDGKIFDVEVTDFTRFRLF